MALFLLVIGYPFVQSLFFGFQELGLIGGTGKFVGLKNLEGLMGSATFWQAVWQTGVFVATSTAGAMVLALVLALVLNASGRIATAMRTAFLIPWILPGVVVSFLWMWLFDTNYGLLNAFSYWLGGPADTNWLDTPGVAMVAVVVAKIWPTRTDMIKVQAMPMAPASPRSNRTKAALYRSIESVVVVPTGPPLVMTKGISKC